MWMNILIFIKEYQKKKYCKNSIKQKKGKWLGDQNSLRQLVQ